MNINKEYFGKLIEVSPCEDFREGYEQIYLFEFNGLVHCCSEDDHNEITFKSIDIDSSYYTYKCYIWKYWRPIEKKKYTLNLTPTQILKIKNLGIYFENKEVT